MRRRDATNHRLFLSSPAGRPGLAALAVSVALHGVLLGLAGRRFLVGFVPPPLIQVSLLDLDNGANGRPSARGSGGSAKIAAGEEAVEPATVPAPAPLRLRQRRPRRVSRLRRAKAVAVAAAPADEGDATVRARQAEMSAAPPRRGSAGLPAGGPGEGDGAGKLGETGRRSGRGGEGSGDQRGYCVYCPEPPYPLMARARGWQGTVRVGLSVSADGSVTEASLRESSGYGVLDRAAIDVARRSRFAPPASRGLPSPLRGRIEYRFLLSKAR